MYRLHAGVGCLPRVLMSRSCSNSCKPLCHLVTNTLCVTFQTDEIQSHFPFLNFPEKQKKKTETQDFVMYEGIYLDPIKQSTVVCSFQASQGKCANLKIHFKTCIDRNLVVSLLWNVNIKIHLKIHTDQNFVLQKVCVLV